MRYESLIAALKNVLGDVGVSPSRVVIGGSGILGALHLRDVNDLDINVTNPSDFLKIMKHSRVTASEFRPNRGKAIIPTSVGELSFFTGPWMAAGEDFSLPSVPTMPVHGIPHWTPDTVLKYKTLMRRPKDLWDIDLLKAYNETKGMSKNTILSTVMTKGAFIYGFCDELDKFAIEEVPFREHQEEPGGAFRLIFKAAKSLKSKSNQQILDRLRYITANIPTNKKK